MKKISLNKNVLVLLNLREKKPWFKKICHPPKTSPNWRSAILWSLRGRVEMVYSLRHVAQEDDARRLETIIDLTNAQECWLTFHIDIH